MMRRFSSSSFTGILRSEVAVGTERLRSMFSTIFSAGPRIGSASAPVSATGAGVGAGAGAGAGACAGAGAAVVCFVTARVSPSVAAATDFAPFPSPTSSVK